MTSMAQRKTSEEDVDYRKPCFDRKPFFKLHNHSELSSVSLFIGLDYTTQLKVSKDNEIFMN